MYALWVWAIAVCALFGADAERGGSSLRGALEALQRRQRGRLSPIPEPQDYEAFYEYLPPQAYAEPDYGVDVEEFEEEPPSKYYIKLLGDNEKPPDTYEYRIIKKNSHSDLLKSTPRKESAFRERTHHVDNDRLKDLFTDNDDDKKDSNPDKVENDIEYAILLGRLWNKYKNQKAHANIVEAPQGEMKLYKEKIVKKRMPDNWGPIAFKRKRSPEMDSDSSILYATNSKDGSVIEDGNDYNKYELPDEERDDMREEYAIAFQPLESESISDLGDENQYSFDGISKRFPVTKRSSEPYYELNNQKKRSTTKQKRRETTKKFRSSSGTDPKLAIDLSKIFGNSDVDVIKSPVKRSSDLDENSHEGKPPSLTIMHHNNSSLRSNTTLNNEGSHEIHGHNIHHPGLAGREIENTHTSEISDSEKPINIKKKSIDWSNYFGIDKRKKNLLVDSMNEDRLKKQYFDTFHKEVIFPLNSFREHNYVKRNFLSAVPNEDNQAIIKNTLLQNKNKRSSVNSNDSKLDSIDRKLKNMEGLIVDEALRYSNVGNNFDSKEEQETKEKLLSRLAAAYSLEKMRKALKEFKQSIQTQRNKPNIPPSALPNEETKEKRVAVKKEKVELANRDTPDKTLNKPDDFEEEQGAGHYVNGKIDEQFSEGYMGGSGRHHYPALTPLGVGGTCPVLARIVQRCHGVDLLAGDRGQVFLPLCSLHQICYLCSAAPPTTCDLVFLSEADTACDGDMNCQQVARSALMALRELHDNLADELDGECETNPCLANTVKLNMAWQRAFQQ